MHKAAYNWLRKWHDRRPVSVIEIGSRNINGTARDHWPNANWTGLDLYAGPGVDWVGDAMQYTPPEPVDRVICCEVFEHTSDWRWLIQRAATWLKPDGWILLTCAGPGRRPHSHHDGGQLRPGEHYQNVSASDLAEALMAAGFDLREVLQQNGDTYAAAVLVHSENAIRAFPDQGVLQPEDGGQ